MFSLIPKFGVDWFYEMLVPAMLWDLRLEDENY